MTAKRKKLDIKPRTAAYIIITILIIIGVAYFILNGSDESENVLSVREVNLNKQNYIGKDITVEGIFYSEGEDFLISTFTTVSNPNPNDQLALNLENIDNDTRNNLTENQKYLVTGILTEIGEFGTIVELVATNVESK